jgi:hypothetical protein
VDLRAGLKVVDERKLLTLPGLDLLLFDRPVSSQSPHRLLTYHDCYRIRIVEIKLHEEGALFFIQNKRTKEESGSKGQKDFSD